MPVITYGEGFSSGFGRFQHSQEFCDVSGAAAAAGRQHAQQYCQSRLCCVAGGWVEQSSRSLPSSGQRCQRSALSAAVFCSSSEDAIARQGVSRTPSFLAVVPLSSRPRQPSIPPAVLCCTVLAAGDGGDCLRGVEAAQPAAGKQERILLQASKETAADTQAAASQAAAVASAGIPTACTHTHTHTHLNPSRRACLACGLIRLNACDDTLSPCLHVLHSPAPNVSAHVHASPHLLTLSPMHPPCRALAGQFAESRSKRIELHLEKAPGEEVRLGTQH